MNRRIALLIAVLVLGSASLAAAQRIDTPYRFFEQRQAAGLFAGHISTDKGAIGLGPESGAAFGGRYHIRMSGPFFLEAEALYFPTTRAVLDTVVVDSAFQRVGEAELGLVTGLVSLRFHITGQRTWHGFLPFLLAGAGVSTVVQKDDADDEEIPSDFRYDFGTTFAGQIGGGIEWFPAERLAVRFDARSVLWQIKAPDGLLLRGQAQLDRPLPQDEWVNNLTFSVGLSFHF
jgi:opacity protein-like surface antigen